MSIQNLEFIFKPSTVALIGASSRESSVGAVLVRNLLKSSYRGEVFLVNPRYRLIGDLPVYSDIHSLPKVPDLAVIATPPETVSDMVEQLAYHGTKAAVIITTGFCNGSSAIRNRLLTAIKKTNQEFGMRIIGPNSMGVIIPEIGLNASIAHVTPVEGNMAFIGQSGAIQTAVLDRALSRNLGFSHFISLGDMAEVNFSSVLDYLGRELRPRAILLHMESITDARRFMSAARATARVKPVLVLKGGRHDEGAKAAAAHTGAPRSNDAVYDAAFRRAGILRVLNLHELFDAVETITRISSFSGDRLAILTNSGGLGVEAADALIDMRGRLAELTPSAMDQLNSSLSNHWSNGNPIDIFDDATSNRYAKALEVTLGDDVIDAILVLHAPNALSQSTETALAIIQTLQQHAKKAPNKLVLTSWLGDGSVSEARALFSKHRIPTYDTPTNAIQAFMQMVRYRRTQEMLLEAPSSSSASFTSEAKRAQAIINSALDEGRILLTDNEARGVLEAYRIPFTSSPLAAANREDESLPAQLRQVMAFSMHSRCAYSHHFGTAGELSHSGRFDLADAIAVPTMDCNRVDPSECRRLKRATETVGRRSKVCEFTLEVTCDPQFGPVISFCSGAIASNGKKDKTFCLPPLNIHLAREAMSHNHSSHALLNSNELTPSDFNSVASILVKLSQLVCDTAGISSMVLKPLLVGIEKIAVLKAEMRVNRSHTPAAQRLAICPYPKEWEKTAQLRDGRMVRIRPVRPEDFAGFRQMFESLSSEEIRMRFLHPIKISSNFLARLTQIDYDREMALVAEGYTDNSVERMLFGSVYISDTIDKKRAEYSILVRREMNGMGLGQTLMSHIIDYAKARQIGEIYGQVLRENAPMLRVCSKLGFKMHHDPEDPGTVIVSLKL
jgi:acetyltransferase